MEGEKTSCIQNKTEPSKLNNLDFIRCVFLTNEQYNINKIHIPKQSLFIEEIFTATKLETIETKINDIIDNISKKLNEGNNGKLIKIPMPIFILISRVLDYNKSILDNEIFIHVPFGESKLGNSKIETNKIGALAIIDYFKSYFTSGLQTQKEIDKYNRSLINSFKFNNNIKLLLYIPYLTQNYKYITNFRDILNSSKFFYTLINSNYFLNFERTSRIDKEFINKLKNFGFNEKSINTIINSLKEVDKKKFTLYDDLINLCFEGGCVSEIGEDIERLVPKYSNDDAINNENATKYSPYLPNKCLSKTNGYICNVKYEKKDNVDIIDFLKTYSIKEIKDSLGTYTDIKYKISQNKEITNNNYKDNIDKYKSPVDLIISIINKYIKEGYSTNLNDINRDIKVNIINSEGKIEEKIERTLLNHYSKDYSENIIKELSIINKGYPGIPEVIFSLYIYKENLKEDKIIYMPWGRKLLSNDNILNIGDRLELNNKLFSINNKYALTINNNGFIFVYNVETKLPIYFLNKKNILNPTGIRFERNDILVSFIDDNKNEKSISILENIPSLVNNCDECKEPFSILLNDDNGDIIIYGNSFFDATNSKFKDLINKEKALILKTNSEDLLNMNFKKKENYVYCYNNENSCLK